MKNFMVLRGCLIKCWKMPYSKVLLDNIGELFESANEPSDPETVTIYLLQVHSFHTKQAYIETSVSRYAAEKSRLQYLSIHWWRKKMTRTAKRKWTEMNLSKI